MRNSGPVKDEPGGSDQSYALALSATEVTRYQQMAERARVAEADLWQRAGIVAGAQVADVGCGPGRCCPRLRVPSDRPGELSRSTPIPGRSPRPGPWSRPAARPTSPSAKVERIGQGWALRHATW